MWQERVSPRGEGEKMKAILTAKVGMFLVVSSVLAIWTLLVAQHVQAHPNSESLPDLSSCSGLPSDAFLAAVNTSPDPLATARSTSDGLTPDHMPKQGNRPLPIRETDDQVSLCQDSRFRRWHCWRTKRVFDGTTEADPISNADALWGNESDDDVSHDLHRNTIVTSTDAEKPLLKTPP